MKHYRRGEKKAVILMFLKNNGHATGRQIHLGLDAGCGGDLSRLLRSNLISAEKIPGDKEKVYSFNRYDEATMDAINLYGLG